MFLLAILLFFAVALVGMTSIIVDSKVMLPLREWVKEKKIPFIFGHELIDMMECHQCAGFWVGMTMWPLALPFLPIEWTFWRLLVLVPMGILVGCAISILAPLTRALQDWLTLNITIPENLWNDQKPIDPPGN
jgi:hypothetical protein